MTKIQEELIQAAMDEEEESEGGTDMMQKAENNRKNMSKSTALVPEKN